MATAFMRRQEQPLHIHIIRGAFVDEAAGRYRAGVPTSGSLQAFALAASRGWLFTHATIACKRSKENCTRRSTSLGRRAARRNGGGIGIDRGWARPYFTSMTFASPFRRNKLRVTSLPCRWSLRSRRELPRLN